MSTKPVDVGSLKVGSYVVVDGVAAVVYRDRSEDEIRDISISGLNVKSNLVHEDGWNIAGCPVNGPSVDVLDGTIAIAWYTAPENTPAVYVAFSKTPIKLSDSILGRVDIVVVAKDTAVVTWLEPYGDNGEAASVMLADVHKDGTVNNRRTVASVSPSRSSGFPRIAKVNGGILVAWTDADREQGISCKFYKLH